MTRVDANISDLFFNTDMDEARVMEKGQFVRFDDSKMLEQATLFLGCLYRLGVAVPTPAELVSDFYGRV